MEFDIRKVGESERRCTRAFVRANKSVQKLIGELKLVETWEPANQQKQSLYLNRSYAGLEVKNNFVEDSSVNYLNVRTSVRNIPAECNCFRDSKLYGPTKDYRSQGDTKDRKNCDSDSTFQYMVQNEKLLSNLQIQEETGPAKSLEEENLKLSSLDNTAELYTNFRKKDAISDSKVLGLNEVVEKFKAIKFRGNRISEISKLDQEKTRLENRIHRAQERLQLNSRTSQDKARDRKAVKSHELKIEMLQCKMKDKRTSSERPRKIKHSEDKYAPFGSSRLRRQKQFRKKGCELFKVDGKAVVGVYGYELFYADEFSSSESDRESDNLISELSFESEEDSKSDYGYVFFPPIPAPFERKRPRSHVLSEPNAEGEQILNALRKIQIIKVPKRKRVAMQRAQLRARQELFERTHNLHPSRKNSEEKQNSALQEHNISDLETNGKSGNSSLTTESKTAAVYLTTESNFTGLRRGKEISTEIGKILPSTNSSDGKIDKLKSSAKNASFSSKENLSKNLSRRRLLYLMGSLSYEHLYPPGGSPPHF
mgnify:CR=1 FL=1